VKKALIFLGALLIFIATGAGIALAGDLPADHIGSQSLTSQEIEYLGGAAFVNEMLVASYFESDTGKVTVRTYGLDGTREYSRELKGNAGYAVTGKIVSASDGKTAVILWKENSGFADFLYASVTTDGANFSSPILIASKLAIYDYDVSVSGSTVAIFYGVGEPTDRKVYLRKSTDGGNTFGAPVEVFNPPDNLGRLYYLSADATSSKAAVVFAYEVHSVDAGGNDVYTMKLYYAEDNSGSFTPVEIYGNNSESPPTNHLFKPIDLAYDISGNPWVAWVSRNTSSPKIWWMKKSGSTWSTPQSITTLDNTASVDLVTNKALFGPGIQFVYTKKNNSQIFIRQASDTGLLSETVFNSDYQYSFVKALSFFGHVAYLSVNYSNKDLNLWFQEILKPGRTGKLRYELWMENFENSSVLNDMYWQITVDPGAAQAKFSETSTYRYTGLKSLWSAGYRGVGGRYVSNMATTARLKYFTEVPLYGELSFYYSFSRNSDPGDVASAGINTLYTIPETTLSGVLWVQKSFVNLLSQAGAVQFRMISNSDSVVDVGLLVDDLKFYGYKYSKPVFTLQTSDDGIIVQITSKPAPVCYIFRRLISESSYQLVGQTTADTYIDRVPAGYYYYYLVAADDRFESVPSEIRSISFTGGSGVDVDRIYGATRIETAVELSKSTFTTASTVILAYAYNFPDALSAAPLAVHFNCPILLVRTDRVDGIVMDEIERLGATKAYIIGGTGVISDAVKASLEAKGLEVERLGGRDRYETSALIARELIELKGETFIKEAYIATGENFPDALSAGGVAGKRGAPILLTKKDTLPAVIRDILEDYSIEKTYILGGTGAVSDSVKNLLPDPERLFGPTRYDTAIEIAKHAISKGFSVENLYITTGENYPDALACSAASGKTANPVILVKKDLPIPAAVASFINTHKAHIDSLTVLGGPPVVSDAVVNALKDLIE
jgi:putative cell wall-binding protein